ncbi:thiamine-phosphate kinase [Deferribacteraceae bacterium V6Fe1]|nr:thiamine-phosphate kinase [Deferribacteraceae bacterium V6Fe1]
MGEFDFIDRLKRVPKEDILSIGDDAAYFDGYLVAKDILIENIHFLPTTPIEMVVKKLFVSNISDICAMGGHPKYCLLGISIPEKYPFIDNIATAVNKMVENYNIELIGGDTTKSKSDMFLSLTVIGKPHKNLLKRSGAKSGDLVYLSRPVGLSKVSLEKELGMTNFNIDSYLHYKNEPETALSEYLSESCFVTSCIDISDGLGRDASHIAKQSGVKIIIDQDKLDTGIFNDLILENPVEYIISSGEEFALLFTVKCENSAEFESICKEKFPDVKRIGYVTEGEGVYLKASTAMKNISDSGFEHKI